MDVMGRMITIRKCSKMLMDIMTCLANVNVKIVFGVINT
jgi:hypothetical protein